MLGEGRIVGFVRVILEQADARKPWNWDVGSLYMEANHGSSSTAFPDVVTGQPSCHM